MGLSAEAYARQLKQLLPRGVAWDLEEGSGLSRFLLAIADELARIDALGSDLLSELDPRSANEFLPDWERVLGLPDAAFGAGTSLSERRTAAATKYTARGGATGAYYLEVAGRMGFVATFDEPSTYTWRLTINLAQSTSPFPLVDEYIRCGSSRAGDRLHTRAVLQLEAVMNRLKQAHTVAWFVYNQ